MYLPSGYVAAFQAAAMIWDDVYEFLEEFPWASRNFIEQGIGRALAGGDISAQGWNFETGDMHPIPVEFWRSPEAKGILADSMLIDLRVSKGSSSIKVLPLIEDSAITEFAPTFISSFPTRPKFPEAQWETFLQSLATIRASRSELGSTTSEKNLGGRKPKYDWDGFWIEVALYGAKEDITSKDWGAFRKHIDDWCSKTWKNSPDVSQIRKKLKPLNDEMVKREKSKK